LHLTEEIVDRAGRTGGTFLHSSRNESGTSEQIRRAAHLKDKFNAEKNDLTPEVLKNLEWLGINTLRTDRRRRYAQLRRAAAQRGIQSHRDSKTMDNDVPGTDYCIGIQHMRDADDPARE